MQVKHALAAVAVPALLTGGLLAAGAGPASASTTGCAFTNGCGTLHGFDAAGNAIAMDAKYKNGTEITIGYVDKPGDGATSYDAVLHYLPGARVTTYADTGLQVRDFDNTCHTAASHDIAPTVTGSPGATGAITAGGNDLSVSTNAHDLTVNGGGTATLNWIADSGSDISSLVLSETYGAGCTALWTTDVDVSGGDASIIPFTLIPGQGNSGGHISETNTGSSVDTFSDSVSGGTFSFTGLPAGVSQSGGVLTADTSTAIPGTYTSVGVVYTQPGGVINTASFTLVIDGTKTTGRGAPVPYYTFVYAANGVWSNDCVTDLNGSGALGGSTCTLGANTYQDFFALDSAGKPSNALANSPGAEFHLQNFLAGLGSPTSCIVDNSALNPATPESDATDELASPAGRQLHDTGSCSAANTQFAWGT